MQKNLVLILVIISILVGIFMTVIWFFVGTFFISGMIAGVVEEITEEHIPLTFGNLAPGFIIISIQSFITAIAFIIATVKAIPSRLFNNLRKNGIWIVVLGSIILIVNPIQFISSILLITGGAIAIKSSYNDDIEVTS